MKSLSLNEVKKRGMKGEGEGSYFKNKSGEVV